MSKHLGVEYKVRMPQELKDKIADSAKELNRSINADIVARLEESFKKIDQDPISYVNDPLVKIHFVGIDLIRYESKMQALRFAIRSIGDSDENLKEKLLYLLDYTQFEKDNLIAELFKDIKDSGVSLDLIPDASIRAKLTEGLANFSQDIATLSFEEMKQKYPDWGSWS